MGFLFRPNGKVFKHLAILKPGTAWRHSLAYVAPRASAAGKTQYWRGLAGFRAVQKTIKNNWFRIVKAKVLTCGHKLQTVIVQYVISLIASRLPKQLFNSYQYSYCSARVPVPVRPAVHRLIHRPFPVRPSSSRRASGSVPMPSSARFCSAGSSFPVEAGPGGGHPASSRNSGGRGISSRLQNSRLGFSYDS